MSRKTIDIEFLKQAHARMTLGSLENQSYIDNPISGKNFRDGINIMLETALHETGNYRGYYYISDYRNDETARQYY